jgi:hypothetical protein
MRVRIYRFILLRDREKHLHNSKSRARPHPREPHNKERKKRNLGKRAPPTARARANIVRSISNDTRAKMCARRVVAIKKSYSYFGALTFMMFQSLYVFAKCMKHNKCCLSSFFLSGSFLGFHVSGALEFGKNLKKFGRTTRARDARRHATSFFHGGRHQ